jgi:hypothetical protein
MRGSRGSLFSPDFVGNTRGKILKSKIHEAIVKIDSAYN